MSDRPSPGGFTLASRTTAASIVYDPADSKVVAHASEDLASDTLSVAGIRPQVRATSELPRSSSVIVGTLGKSRLVDQLVAAHKINVSALRGAWESFVIQTVNRPAPGIERALVIAGSDRRGTAYGVYEISRAMGVSPWSWWADVTPEHKQMIIVPAGTRRFGPPSVRYRGIFINDEDWGLFPWASRTFDPKYGNIGPKTYERVFELLLRLKGNTLWPAMHKTSQPFNADPANARLADDYAIVMGSSHAEPMLRNNVGEWNAPADTFNYVTNPTGVRAYWEKRVRTNARYESLWTLGMRGIHDSSIVGAKTVPEKVDLVNRIFTDQRQMLRKYVDPTLRTAHQIFVPYKEVLELYRNGLKVPEDATIVWPDDNYGYIRQFPSAAERERPGGAGVYYHLSYLGAPLAYLWLSTTPPALVQEELTRAYDQGARTFWVANVGDIKPAEIGITHYFDLAWNVDALRPKSQRAYLQQWAAENFGIARGPEIGDILDEYFRLNFERRPEHLYWASKSNHSDVTTFTAAEIDARLNRFEALTRAVAAVQKEIPPERTDAFFELVGYPVRASAAANMRAFAAERYAELIDSQPALARSAGGEAVAADVEIKDLTRRYNEQVAGGKWRRIMAEEPADSQWPIFRPRPVALPSEGLRSDPTLFLSALAKSAPVPEPDVVEAENYVTQTGWRLIEGLGRGEGTMIATAPGASLTLRVSVPRGTGEHLELGLLPLYANDGDGSLQLDAAIDNGPPRRLKVPRDTDSAEWSRAVLDNLLRVSASSSLAPGEHQIHITARSSGIALDRVMIVGSAASSVH